MTPCKDCGLFHEKTEYVYAGEASPPRVCLEGQVALLLEKNRILSAELSAALVQVDELTAQRDAFGQKASHLSGKLKVALAEKAILQGALSDAIRSKEAPR
jgi:hypothetical protein